MASPNPPYNSDGNGCIFLPWHRRTKNIPAQVVWFCYCISSQAKVGTLVHK
jgi:hypothetical protein